MPRLQQTADRIGFQKSSPRIAEDLKDVACIDPFSININTGSALYTCFKTSFRGSGTLIASLSWWDAWSIFHKLGTFGPLRDAPPFPLNFSESSSERCANDAGPTGDTANLRLSGVRAPKSIILPTQVTLMCALLNLPQM